jgi:hypothetical protein
VTVRRLVPTVLVAACLVSGVAASTAEAKWGPSNNCGIAANETIDEHCYAIAQRLSGIEKYASIAAEDNEVASITDWASGGLITNEEWIGFGNITHEWIEDGQIMGNYRDSGTAYPFYAWKKPGEAFQKYETTGPVESGSGKYNYFMIYDEKVAGEWRAYWSGATNKVEWFAASPALDGFAHDWYTEQEAGMEAGTEYSPYHAGRDEVAASNTPYTGSSWLAWTGATKFSDPGVCINTNRELTAAGNIEWTPGHNECKGNEP